MERLGLADIEREPFGSMEGTTLRKLSWTRAICSRVTTKSFYCIGSIRRALVQVS